MAKDKKLADDVGGQTIAVHTSRSLNNTSAVAPPIWQTTTFSADNAEDFATIAVETTPAEFYTRYGNPTHKQVEATIAALEGAERALVMGSGMGAIFAAVMSHLDRGDHVVAQRNHYAGTTTLFSEILPRWGVECTIVDQTRTEQFSEALRPNTKLIYVETPTNPLMQITDLQAIAALGKSAGILTICDNTFPSPINQKPLSFGIDATVHSATKYLGGHHDVTAGVVTGSTEFIEKVWKFAIVSGAALSPFDGWLLLRGLRTVGLRIDRHNRNAIALARFLEDHPSVARVFYPGLESHPQHDLARRQMLGFTGMLSIELNGGFEAAERLISRLQLAVRAASLGGFETLVVHPAAMWGLQLSPEKLAAAGLSESLVRISTGLEDEDDLIHDFAQALA